MNLDNIVNHINPLLSLIDDGGAYDKNHVGYVYQMNFNEAFVLTNDSWKIKVAGIPHNSFLIATSFNLVDCNNTPKIDREMILLRVLNSVALPNDLDMLKTKIDFNQQKTSLYDENSFDPITQNELQFSGLKCRILGTFYLDEKNSIVLGSDIENYMSSTKLKVFRPRGKSLQLIVNHVNENIRQKAIEEAKKSGFNKMPSDIEIGTVRYTSTQRLHRANSEELVVVKIQPTDFLSRRTAILGMTRTGKSNTVKTTISAVAVSALKGNQSVGQIIFDINGEYANANHQDDGSSIFDVFSDQCIRYRAKEQDGFEDLRINFYSEVAQALNLIQNLFKSDGSSQTFTGQDIDGFMSSTLEEPDKDLRGEYYRWKFLKSIFQCILSKAGYIKQENFQVSIPFTDNVIKQVKDDEYSEELIEKIKTTRDDSPRGFKIVDIQDAQDWFMLLRDKNLVLKNKKDNKIGILNSSKHSFIDTVAECFLNILAQKNSQDRPIAGFRAIQKYTEYHSSKNQKDITKDIIRHLSNGKIVILDLSVGPVDMRKVLSERIAFEIFNNSFNLMNSGQTPPNIVIYVEEAHNLIGKKAELTTIWPRIAKEGAKAKIAFVYATQEPSSIHPNILANTENWFVTHLNNEDELRALDKFYDFSDFHDSLKNAQDVGFARIKTLSSPFVIPTQINKFEPNKIKDDITILMGDCFNAI